MSSCSDDDRIVPYSACLQQMPLEACRILTFHTTWFFCLLPWKFLSTSMEASTHFHGNNSTSMRASNNFHGYFTPMETNLLPWKLPWKLIPPTSMVLSQLPWKLPPASVIDGSRPASIQVAPASLEATKYFHLPTSTSICSCQSFHASYSSRNSMEGSRSKTWNVAGPAYWYRTRSNASDLQKTVLNKL